MKKQAGFTLIEVMVVVVILAILAAIIVPRILNRPEQARRIAAKQDIAALDNALSLYKLDNGVYPTNDQGLMALVKLPTTPPIPQNWATGGYLKTLPKDPWGQPYHYRNPGQHRDIDIFTYGPSNQPNKDTIGNWTQQ